MQFSRRILCIIDTSTNHDYVIFVRRNVKDSHHRHFCNFKMYECDELIPRPRSPTACKMIMNLKKQRPCPKGAVEPTKKKIPNVCMKLLCTFFGLIPYTIPHSPVTDFAYFSNLRNSTARADCLWWNVKMALILLHLWISRSHHVAVLRVGH
jgi:hypothetical protein